jgi:hypothetical protein
MPHLYRYGPKNHSYKHGKSGTPTYRVWQGMIQRCRCQPNHPNFRYYAGRGITVCERWQLFENFLEDMGERPEGKTLDRIDNDGHYEPGNCRWATPREQFDNSRGKRALSDDQRQEAVKRHADGDTLTAIAKSYGVAVSTIAKCVKAALATDGQHA